MGAWGKWVWLAACWVMALWGAVAAPAASGDRGAEGSPARQLEEEYGVVRDPGANARVQRLGARLRRAAHCRAHLRFRILNCQEPNGVTLPGGEIYVTAGLLKLLPQDELLAAALAHEVAHVALGHLAAVTREQREGVSRVGVAAQNGESLPANATPPGTSRAFARERAADAAAARYLAAARLDPRAALRLLQRLARQPELNTQGSLTHPAWPDRIRSLRSSLARMGYREPFQ